MGLPKSCTKMSVDYIKKEIEKFPALISNENRDRWQTIEPVVSGLEAVSYCFMCFGLRLLVSH